MPLEGIPFSKGGRGIGMGLGGRGEEEGGGGCYLETKLAIDKISSLSCQKVADSITSSKMGNNVAKQASVLLRNIPEYIRRYPSAYCRI